MHIDLVSDVVCPWCAVGLGSLQRALDELGDSLGPVTLRLHPFELNPRMGPEGEDVAEHLQAKYGLSAEQLASNRQMLRERAAAVGVTMRPEGPGRIWNTRAAHRLLHWAAEVQPDPHNPHKHAPLHPYYPQARNPPPRETLQAAAAQAGLPTDEAAEVIDSGRFDAEVQAAEQDWLQAGIQAVPAFVLQGRYLVSGAQPPEALVAALRDIAARAAAEL